ncbi:MAG TPA: hypothetical protein VFQ61_13665, partial [Polyangiaceae bacterium]|nr:hypothetical protein [Polyangiaceae bacterium]
GPRAPSTVGRGDCVHQSPGSAADLRVAEPAQVCRAGPGVAYLVYWGKLCHRRAKSFCGPLG